MMFMDKVNKLHKKTLRCQGALKFLEKNRFLNKMKFQIKKKARSKKMDILVIQYPKLYQSMKNHSKN